MEKIIIYHKSDFTKPIIADRDRVHAEKHTTYDGYFISTIDAYIFTLDGKLILQKRAKNKKIAPGLLVPTVGGHVEGGETSSFTALHEILEEFGHPAIIVSDEISWETVFSKFTSYLDRCVPCKKLFQGPVEYIGTDGKQAQYFLNIYIGVSSGIPNNLDESVEEFRTITLEEIDDLLINSSEIFTNAIKKQFSMFRKELYTFREMLGKIFPHTRTEMDPRVRISDTNEILGNSSQGGR